MTQAIQWGPKDKKPLTAMQKKAAQTVGLTQATYKAGSVLLDRAPWHILESWKREELTTPQAYAALMEWEGTA